MRRAGNKNYPGQTAANNEIESVQYCAEDRTEDEVSESNRTCLLYTSEQLLLDLGFHQLRVRIHGTLARIEVLPDELQKVLENRNQIVKAFKEYGFTYVTMDLQGYRMGSMNETLKK